MYMRELQQFNTLTLCPQWLVHVKKDPQKIHGHGFKPSLKNQLINPKEINDDQRNTITITVTKGHKLKACTSIGQWSVNGSSFI